MNLHFARIATKLVIENYSYIKNRGGWENDDVIGSWAMSAGNSSQLAVPKENKQIK